MYKEHFGLSHDPFSIAPDPRFLFLSDVHNEALAHLLYGFSNGGFVLITGEVGTGKTTLLRSLLDRTPPDLDVAFILNPRLTVRELLETLCDELGVNYVRGELQTVKQYIDLLNKHLLKTHQTGRSTVVIIDEAQNLSPAVLEQIRLLTNLETNEKKLLRIILLGQPELADMLDRTELRQLAQRITARYHLTLLSKAEVAHYVSHRLARAGGNPAIFTSGAINTLYRLSKGTPRLINVIADRSLLGAYVEGKYQVDGTLVRNAAREVFGSNRSRNLRYYAGAAASVAVIAAVMLWAWLSPDTQVPQPVATQTAPTGERRSDTQPAEIASVTQQRQSRPPAESLVTVSPQTSEQPAGSAPANNRRSPTSVPMVREAADLSRPATGPVTIQRQAYRAVFALWGADYAVETDQIPCDFAPSVGLQCLRSKGGWSEVASLNSPLILELWDDQSTPYFAALLSAENNLYKLQIGDRVETVSPRDLRDNWFGSYVVLWQTPPDYYGSLREGDTHPSVAWLHSNIAQLLPDLPLGAPDNFFNAELHTAVMAFQTGEGLLADGIVGPLTWIRLSDRLNMPAPKLRG